MTRFFDKLLNIRPTEWPRVLLLFLMISLTNAGAIWGSTIAYAAFLKQVGLEALPWVLASSAALSILAIAIYTAFVDRITDDKLLVAIFAFGVASIVLGLALLWLNLPLIAYPVLYLLFLVWVAVFNPHFATYVNSFYDIQSAKRVLPVVSAGARVGTVVAGLTMPLLTTWVVPSTVIVIWLLTYIAIMGLAWLMPHLLRKERTQSNQSGHTPLAGAASSERQRSSYLSNMREGFRYTIQSTYLRWMATGTLLLRVLLALIEYRSSGLLLEVYGTSEELANFLAVLDGVGNIIVLPMLLFVMSHLVARMGVGNASLIFPTGNLVICGGLVLTPGLASATAAYLDRDALRRTFHASINNLFYNAIPLRMKGRVRAFVSGLIVPVGSLIGSLLLLLPLKSTAWFVSALIGVLAVAYMVSAWFIRQQYSQALVKMLEQEDYSFLLSQEASDLTIADPAMLTQLQKKLEESTSYELTVFMAKLISQVGGSKAIPILGQATRTATDARTRSGLVDVIFAADLRGDAIRQLYTDFLADPDGRVRRSAIAGLEQVTGPTDRQFLAQMLEMAHDPDIDVRVQALTALVRSGDFYQFTPAVQVLDQLLADEDPHRRALGVHVLGQIHDKRAIRKLIKYQSDPADEVRLEAAVAVEALSRNTLPSQVNTMEIVIKMIGSLKDPIERVRQAALIVLGRLGARESHQAMINALTDFSPQVRATAVDVLAQAGKSIIPVVHPQLESPDPQLRKMATVVLGRVDPREFGPLIVGSNIMGNLLFIYRNYSLVEALAKSPYVECPSIVVLQSMLREQNQQLVDEIFYLLTAIHDPGAIKIIVESLRSESPRVRANATEALESLTSPQTASLITPLFDPELPPAQLLALSEDTWDMAHPNTAQAIQQLVTNPDEPWLRAITIYALGEIGAALTEERGEREEKRGGKETTGGLDRGGAGGRKRKGPGKRARRSPPADLFAAITDTSAEAEDEDTPSQVREKPGKRARRSPPTDLFGAITDTPAENLGTPPHTSTSPPPHPFTLPEIEAMLEVSLADPVEDVRLAAQAARRMITGRLPMQAGWMTDATRKEEILLSTIERVIFLKEVSFFRDMTIEQLKVLANVCKEELFEEGTRIFEEGDTTGVLYVVVSGRVSIERETRRGSYARLATLGAHTYFGEMALFDNSPRSATALALQDTLTLSLSREPLIALARQYPNLSLELIKVLSDRLREANNRITELTRSRPRELQKFYDQFD